MNVQYRNDSSYFENGELKSKKMDRIEIDTFYQEAYSLIQFTSPMGISVQGIGGDQKIGTYSIELDTIYVFLEDMDLKILHKDEKLQLLDLDSGWQKTHFFYERMRPTGQLSKNDIEKNFKEGDYYRIQADSLSINNGIEFHFLDSGKVGISRYNSWTKWTSSGKYQKFIFEKNLFLYVMDERTLDDWFYRIYKSDNGVFEAQTFEENWGALPERKSLRFSPTLLPSQNELGRIEEKLIGSWLLDEDSSIPVDTLLNDYQVMQEPYFELELMPDKRYTIEYSGFFTNEGQGQFLNKKLSGTWALGRTGRYIELNEFEGYLKFASFDNLTSNSVDICLNITSITTSNFSYSNHGMKLKK